jgi:lysophospholipase L1-like esterase
MTVITTATCHPDPQRFPPGTVVGAYKATAWSGRDHTVAPTGAADTSATVQADGSLTFSGLTDQTAYFGYAAGSGSFRFSTRHDYADDISASLVGNTRLAGNRVFFIGDSITANALESSGAGPRHTDKSWPLWASMKAAGKFVCAGQAATGGYTVGQVASTHLPTALAAAPRACVVLAGRNDVLNAVPFATTVADFKTIFSTLKAAAILPVVCTMTATTGNTAAQSLAQSKINLWLRNYAAVQGFPLVDFAAVTTDPTNDSWISGYNQDASHPTGLGAKAMGDELARVLAPAMPPYAPPRAIAQTLPTTSQNMFNDPLWLAADGNADGTPDAMTVFAAATHTDTIVSGSADGVKGNWSSMVNGSGAVAYGLKSTVTMACTPGDHRAVLPHQDGRRHGARRRRCSGPARHRRQRTRTRRCWVSRAGRSTSPSARSTARRRRRCCTSKGSCPPV